MKKTVLLSVVIVVFSCIKKDNPMIGLWKVDSKFYKATCKIVEEEKEIKGLVFYYNDDTTIYKYEEGKAKNYFFNNLIKKNAIYVDAVSGATKSKGSNEAVTLNLLSKDTLEVTTYIMHKPVKDIWIRQ